MKQHMTLQPRFRHYNYNTITFDVLVPPFAMNSWKIHVNNAAACVVANRVGQWVIQSAKTHNFQITNMFEMTLNFDLLCIRFIKFN